MQISGKHVWQGSTVQFLKRKTLTSLSVKFKETHSYFMATSKPDQHNKTVRLFLRRANRVLKHIPDDQKSGHLPGRNRLQGFCGIG